MQSLLIIDDSRLTRSMIRMIASQEIPGSRILEAADADQARRLLAEDRVDLITVDHNMPGESGLEFLAELKQLAPEARICMITANLQQEMMDACEAAGVSYVAKPVRAGTLGRFLKGD